MAGKHAPPLAVFGEKMFRDEFVRIFEELARYVRQEYQELLSTAVSCAMRLRLPETPWASCAEAFNVLAGLPELPEFANSRLAEDLQELPATYQELCESTRRADYHDAVFGRLAFATALVSHLRAMCDLYTRLLDQSRLRK